MTSETSPNGIVRGYVYRNANNQDAFGTDLNRQVLYVNSAPAGALSLTRVNEIETCLTTAASCGAADEAAIDAAIADIASPGAILDPASLTSTAADVARWLKLRNNRQDWAASTAFAVGTCIAPNGWQWERYKVTTAGTSGSTQPAWPASGTVADGSITWTKTNCTPVLVYRQYIYDSGSPSRHQLVRQDDHYGTPTYYHYDARGNQDYRGSTPFASTPNQTWTVQGLPTQLVDDSGVVVQLSWDADHARLASWTRSGVTRTMSYDPRGRLVKVVASGSASWSTELAWSAGRPASATTGSNRYFFERDSRYNVVALRDGAGSTSAKHRFSAFGEASGMSSSGTGLLGYQGLQRTITVGAGLHWMGQRFHSSAQGRFLSPDIIENRPGATASAYNYADNDPINHSDPSGAYSIKSIVGPSWWYPYVNPYNGVYEAKCNGFTRVVRFSYMSNSIAANAQSFCTEEWWAVVEWTLSLQASGSKAGPFSVQTVYTPSFWAAPGQKGFEGTTNYMTCGSGKFYRAVLIGKIYVGTAIDRTNITNEPARFC